MSQSVGNAGKFELSALMRRCGGPLTNILEPAVTKDLLVPVRFRFPDDSVSQISSVGTDSEAVTETDDDVSLTSTENLDRQISKPQNRLQRNRKDHREADDSDEDTYRTQKPKLVNACNMRARPSSATSSSSRSSSRLGAPVRRQAAVDREEKQMLHRLFAERKTPDLTSKKPPRQTGDQSRRPASVDYSDRRSANGDHRRSSEQNVRQLPRHVDQLDYSARNSAFDGPNRGRQRDVIADEHRYGDEKPRFCQSYCSEHRHSGSGFGKYDSQARFSSAKRTQRRDSVESDVPRHRRSSVEAAPPRLFRESTQYDQRRHRSDSIDTNGSHAGRKRSQRTSEDAKLQELALLEHLVHLLSEDS